MTQLELWKKNSADTTGQIALEDVFAAYYECRKSKRRTTNALEFELDFEAELVRLWREINSNTYKIGRSIAFIIKYPLQREVFAANFRDRIVHHLVISKINGLFEQEFAADSYSCRAGKGTLCGVRRVSEMMKECSEGYKKDCYILKLDIRSFFMTINKPVLYNMLAEFLEQNYYCADKRIILRLVKQIVFYEPENHCAIKGKRSDWNGLPYYKSLFWSEKSCGLPIGNLTSQIFANFYLNKLDKYIKEDLGFEYYGRYVDDFVLMHEDKGVLTEARRKIERFLQEKLRLKLHPQKVYLQHYSKGVRFIGAVIKPNRIYIGRRTKNNLYRKIYDMLPKMARSIGDTLENLESFTASVNSYLGFMRHYNTYNLRSHVLSKLDESFLSVILERTPHAEKVSIDKAFRPIEQKKRQLRSQRQYRRNQQRKFSKENKDGIIQSVADLS